MTIRTATGSTDKLTTAVDELTEAELETVAAGGGGTGINPSRMGGAAGGIGGESK